MEVSYGLHMDYGLAKLKLVYLDILFVDVSTYETNVLCMLGRIFFLMVDELI